MVTERLKRPIVKKITGIVREPKKKGIDKEGNAYVWGSSNPKELRKCRENIFRLWSTITL